MKLTKGEFSQFSLQGQINLLKAYGQPEGKFSDGFATIEVYTIFDFYAEFIKSPQKKGQLKSVHLISLSMMTYYKTTLLI